MPSLSPGAASSSFFDQILPGQPTAGFQSFTTFTYRWKRYIVYISGKQLNILKSPIDLVQAISFDEELVAVKAEDGHNGRVAVATSSDIWVLKPAGAGQICWNREVLLKNGGSNRTRTICWAAEGEILVGGTHQLCLYGTSPSSQAASPIEESAIQGRQPLWTKPVANPLRFASFSPGFGLIATAGDRDRLVKVWRRLSYEEAIFDFVYLPHGGIVTYLEWRPADTAKLDDDDSINRSEESCEVLYTISSDGNMRIWRTNSHNDLNILSLYTTIDLVSAIPHSPLLTTTGTTSRPARYAFVISASAYSTAVSAALKTHPQRQVKHAIEHLKEVSSKHPDVVVALDTQGRMSAWGLSSIGHKRRPESESVPSPFHIAHSEDLGLCFSQAVPTSFETFFDGDVLNILAHSFGETVKWWRGTVENFSSSAALDFDRGRQIAAWQGAGDSIVGLRTSRQCDGLVSWTPAGHLIEWTVASNGSLHESRKHDCNGGIQDVDTAQRGQSMLLLCSEELQLARLADRKGIVAASHSLDKAKGLKLLKLESHVTGADEMYLAYDTSGNSCLVLVNPTRNDWASNEPTIEVIHRDTMLPLDTDSNTVKPQVKKLYAVLHPRKSGWLRIAGVDSSGVVHRRDIPSQAPGQSQRAGERSLSFATGVEPGEFVMTSSSAAVLSASGDEIVIIDLKEGYVEHQQKLTTKAQCLLFSGSSEESPLTEHGALAIGYSQSVDILIRSRYDHNRHNPTPHWTNVKSVSIADVGLNISSISWLDHGRLAIGAGNSIFITNNDVAKYELDDSHRQKLELGDAESATLQQVASLIRAPATIWQPRVLRHLVLHGFFDAVVEILLQLQLKLKFYSNGDDLDALLDLDIDQLLSTKENSFRSDDETDFSELADQLAELDLPFTSDEDQERLLLVVRTVSYVARHRQSLDMNAIRYLAYWRYHVLLDTHQKNGDIQSVDGAAYKAVPLMNWREINFAYRSRTQQPLLDILVQYYENKLDWTIVRSLGITLWLHNIKAAQSESSGMASLEQIFDALGQTAYRSSQPPDPANAALFLLALRKKAVLLSLWRVAIGNREQKSTQNFLRRDFDIEDNKTAARKNAYALMGKRRFQYAAAFFILADDPMSAISIIAGQCEDLPLAISVARAYCGDGSPLLCQFVQERVIPGAQKTADRWQLSWAYGIIAEPSEALRVLLVDVGHLTHDRLIRIWQQDDPATLTFYRELRDEAKLHAPAATPCDEYRAVLRSARILRRLGYWLLALKLVQYWSFVSAERSHHGDTVKASNAVTIESNGAPSLLDQFGSQDEQKKPEAASHDTPSMLNAIETPNPTSDADDRAAKAAALLAKIRAKNTAQNSAAATNLTKEPDEKKPTQFDEPVASSILDSFGF